MPTAGSQSTEFKMTAGTTGLAALGVLMEMVKGGTMFSENVLIALVIAITAIGISYNISRGLAKYEYTKPGDKPLATDGASSEAKLTAALSVGGILPLLTDMMQGRENVSDKMTITLIACVAAMVLSYNISRGLAKYEHQGEAPSSLPPGASGA